MSIQVYRGDILVSEPALAKSQWEKARGLMFSKPHDVLFHFNDERRLKFHMVFVFFPIDIIFLDHELKVVDLKPRFRPFTFYYSKAKSSTVLEAYDGFINDHSITIGDTLKIVHEGEIDRPSDVAPPSPATQRKNVFHGTSLGKPRDAQTKTISRLEPERLKEGPSKDPNASAKKPAKRATNKAKTTPKKTAKRTKASTPKRATTAKKPSAERASAKRTAKKSPAKSRKPSATAKAGSSSKASKGTTKGRGSTKSASKKTATKRSSTASKRTASKRSKSTSKASRSASKTKK